MPSPPQFGIKFPVPGHEQHGAPPPTWRGVHAVAALAIVLRLIVAWSSERISHPDELFQYLEQGHRLLYGFGFIPWEYRFGIRNWLLPDTLAGILGLLKWIGLDRPTAYIPVVKSMFAIVSVCVVYSSYAIGRRMLSERTGRVAAVFAAVWHELLYVSTVSTPEVLSAYAIFCAFALMTGARTARRGAMIGLLLGLSVALRLQHAVPAGALWLLVVIHWNWRHLLPMTAASLAVVSLSGWLDAWTWGTPFVSFYLTVLFNLRYGVAEYFGRHSFVYYFYTLTMMSMGLHLLAGGYALVAWRRCWPVVLLAACVLLPYSVLTHKEYRFVFLAVPFLLVLLADAVTHGLPQLHRLLRTPRAPLWAMTIVVAVSAVGCFSHGVFRRDDRLVATLDLSRRADIEGVLDLTGPWWESGGFYYLHRDVPYYFERQTEGLPSDSIRTLVSHVLVSAGKDDIPGFRVSTRHHSVVIMEQVSPPQTYRRLEKDGREPRLAVVEDRYTPTVRRRY